MTKTKPQKLWAIVNAKGKIVTAEKKISVLEECLIFKKKWRANAATWHKGETVIEVKLSFVTRD